MSLAVFASPKLARVLDVDLKPIDVWVIEFPLWWTKYLCDLYHQSLADHHRKPQDLTFDGSHSQEVACPTGLAVYLKPLTFDSLTVPPLSPSFGMEACAMNEPLNSPPNPNCFVSSNSPDFQQIPSSYSDMPVGVPHLNSSEAMFPSNPNTLTIPEVYDTNALAQQSLLYQQQDYVYQSCIPTDPYDSSPTQTNEFSQSQELENSFVPIVDEHPFFFESKTSKISGFLSNSHLGWGFSHPLGIVLRYGNIFNCCFILHSGITCYVKFTPGKIMFSNKQVGISYLIDEAGVRTGFGSFKSYQELVVDKKRRGCRSSFDQTIYEDYYPQDDEKSIRIEQCGLRFCSESRDYKNLYLSLKKFYLSSTLHHVRKRTGHIYVRSVQHRFMQSVYCNGNWIEVKFHTQVARLGCHGELSLV